MKTIGFLADCDLICTTVFIIELMLNSVHQNFYETGQLNIVMRGVTVLSCYQSQNIKMGCYTINGMEVTVAGQGKVQYTSRCKIQVLLFGSGLLSKPQT